MIALDWPGYGGSPPRSTGRSSPLPCTRSSRHWISHPPSSLETRSAATQLLVPQYRTLKPFERLCLFRLAGSRVTPAPRAPSAVFRAADLAWRLIFCGSLSLPQDPCSSCDARARWRDPVRAASHRVEPCGLAFLFEACQRSTRSGEADPQADTAYIWPL